MTGLAGPHSSGPYPTAGPHGGGSHPAGGPHGGPQPAGGPHGGGLQPTAGPNPGGPDGGPPRDEMPEAPEAPVRRLRSLAVAAFSVLLAVGLITGAHIARTPYALVIFVVQALFVLAWATAGRPPAPRVIVVVGLLTAAAADAAAVWSRPASLEPLAYLIAGGFVAGVAGQLSRREGRLRVGDSLAASLSIAVGVAGSASLIVLTRHQLGAESITVCLLATGVALFVARVSDAVRPYPRLAPQVARGALGLVLGAMLGTAAAAVAGSYLVGITPGAAALAGLLTATVAVLVDLSTAYAEAGQALDSDGQVRGLAASLLAPLAAFALAAPAAYAISALLLVPRL